jgi:hypothetical protein
MIVAQLFRFEIASDPWCDILSAFGCVTSLSSR